MVGIKFVYNSDYFGNKVHVPSRGIAQKLFNRFPIRMIIYYKKN